MTTFILGSPFMSNQKVSDYLRPGWSASNRVMQHYVDRGTFAGIVTLIARKGQVAHLETFGWQELETKRPMTADTIFRIYSMTKPITSAAAMMLCEEGQLRLVGPGLALHPGVQGCAGDGRRAAAATTTWCRPGAR